MDVYDPLYIFYYLLVLGFIYIPIFLYTVTRFQLTGLGWILAILSAGGYLLVGAYMVGAGIYSDEEPTEMLFGIGFLEMTLLAYPYLLILLAVVLGKKGERYS